MNKILRLVVVGTGKMAKIRTDALLQSEQVMLVGIASRSIANAKRFALEHGCDFSTSKFQELTDCAPDLVLIEVPHKAQTNVVEWGLRMKYHMLIGSCMAMNSAEMDHIQKLAQTHNLILEGGFEARYKGVWNKTKEIVENGTIGEVCGVQATACWGADPDSWYYSQDESGGMPITHMTYAFLNPLIWIFGKPVQLSAIANGKGPQRENMVNEVTCCVNLEFDDQILCQLLASYIQHDQAPAWKVFIHGTKGSLEIMPGEFDSGEIVRFATNQHPEKYTFEDVSDPFALQAQLLIRSIGGEKNLLQNTPTEGRSDVEVAEAIARSLQLRTTVSI